MLSSNICYMHGSIWMCGLVLILELVSQCLTVSVSHCLTVLSSILLSLYPFCLGLTHPILCLSGLAYFNYWIFNSLANKTELTFEKLLGILKNYFGSSCSSGNAIFIGRSRISQFSSWGSKMCKRVFTEFLSKPCIRVNNEIKTSYFKNYTN